MPQLGESIAEATIVDIKVKPGDEVADDQEIIEVETNKAVMGVTTPCKGKIAEVSVQLKETYPVGAVLGYVEASEADAARFAKQAPHLHSAKSQKKFPRAPTRRSLRHVRRRSLRVTATAHALADCRFQLRRKAQHSCPRAFEHEWPSCS